ncbi:MAG: aspartate kinase [Candidatus Kapabacteria bacterium]|nr:aspartate kinase [Candidatus Kapabacteria bacterium]
MDSAALRVHKLGGSILSDAAAIRQAVGALSAVQQRSAVVVVSACAGVTDRLYAIGQQAATGNAVEARRELQELLEWHCVQVRQLLPPEAALQTEAALRELAVQADQLCQGVAYLCELTPRTSDALLAFGELFASRIVADALRTVLPVPVLLADARHYLVTDATFGRARPQLEELCQRVCCELVEHLRGDAVVVTQGFIGATPEGITTTLGRGGSDLSAALFAVAVGAEEVVIWKNVPGVFTADPAYVADAELVAEISAVEMRELALAGARVLHSEAIEPAVASGIRVRVRSVTEPSALGTLILARREAAPVPLALAWRQQCWVYHCPLSVFGSVIGHPSVLLAAVSRSGGILVAESPVTSVGEEETLSWERWPAPQALISVVGKSPEQWAVSMLERLMHAGISCRACFVESPWALRVLVPQELWGDTVSCIHQELLRWRRRGTVPSSDAGVTRGSG